MYNKSKKCTTKNKKMYHTKLFLLLLKTKYLLKEKYLYGYKNYILHILTSKTFKSI